MNEDNRRCTSCKFYPFCEKCNYPEQKFCDDWKKKKER